ncbi:hypothetical protein TREMEDRAFT_63924 [Tremella mesenterica DSM 1558]|uniref:uncharacterized protein n=1 Tax=Tremella mesenterica (strain ATCC 24925 / CBS 8224 / DSM 1558 / NBRC 9311 / NRRL Y-6157 / RJB 2259-6 / UBC 559-6) TaxID=578456 RepID=UPI0003F4A429|nr:uncharacterized protein TREMEDRAFT_63924 [Tremella mesenterica DSM 1558]EIW68038.1 hypothetical protein TREMEDRAFT_63924 [Tremella mesenterica DSM 1558]
MDYQLLSSEFPEETSHEDIVGAADLAAQLERARNDSTFDEPSQSTALTQDGRALGDDGGHLKDDQARGEDGVGLGKLEKRARQKDQNRKAAERSRQKRRDEQSAIEANITNMQEENAQLRAKLQTLLSSRPEVTTSTIVPPPPPTLTQPIVEPNDPTAVDHAYLAKLQAELEQCRATLLSRQLEYVAISSGRPDQEKNDELEARRVTLLGLYKTLVTLQAEATSISKVTNALNLDKDHSERQWEVLRKEIVRRRNILMGDRPDLGENEGDERVDETGDEPGDRELLVIRGWVDEAVRNWDPAAETAA